LMAARPCTSFRIAENDDQSAGGFRHFAQDGTRLYRSAPLREAAHTAMDFPTPVNRRLWELLIAGVLLFTAGCNGPQPAPQGIESVSNSDQELANAFESHRSGFQITGEGEVSRILADDNEGGR